MDAFQDFQEFNEILSKVSRIRIQEKFFGKTRFDWSEQCAHQPRSENMMLFRNKTSQRK